MIKDSQYYCFISTCVILTGKYTKTRFQLDLQAWNGKGEEYGKEREGKTRGADDEREAGGQERKVKREKVGVARGEAKESDNASTKLKC